MERSKARGNSPRLTIHFSSYLSEGYSELNRKSKTDIFAKIVNSQKSLTIFAKSTILDV